ncbi:MAG TPA: asparaginase [Gemmatimonadales bacterium]|jgi:L-asparaginase II|nr:asparaginase [Gemmatimonadales bacterium]
MAKPALQIETTRGELVESVHPVSVAVVAASGALLAASGDPELVTWWRSAAKPFQALPLLQDGAAERFALSDEELALICASHSSESRHLEVVSRLMARLDITDQDLSCGVHPPLSPAVAQAVMRGAAVPTPRWSNCSGKHTGMLALAKHHGWPLAGYQAAGHPVQERILAEVSRWTGVAEPAIALAIDGCTAVCFGLSLRAMALAYARFGVSDEAAPRRLAAAMTGDPFLVGGTGRLCTDLMRAWPGGVLAKVGAEGIYSAALPSLGIGVALKVHDGETRAASLALLEVLRQLLTRIAPSQGPDFGVPELAKYGRQPLRNTRGTVTGELRPAGVLHFVAA